MNQREMNERRSAVLVLFGLGLSYQDVANALDTSVSAIVNIVRQAGGAKAFQQRKAPAIAGARDEVFQDVLMYYVRIRDSRPPMVLKRALERFLGLREASLFAHAVMLSMEVLMQPQYPPTKEGYYRFMAALFGERALPANGVPVAPNGVVLNRYLDALEFSGSAIPTRDTLGGEIVKFFVAEQRDFIAPIWREDSELYAEIDRQIDQLSAVARKVIHMRFGMGWPRRHTLEEVAADFGDRDRARVRQIEAKAIRQIECGPDAHKLQKYMHVPSM